MAKKTKNINQEVKPRATESKGVRSKDFIVASPYYHSFASAIMDKEKDLMEYGDYTSKTKAYTKDFGPIVEKTDLELEKAPKQSQNVEIQNGPKLSPKKQRKEIERKKAEQEAKAKMEQKQSRIEEAKLKKRQARVKKIKRKKMKKEKDYFFIMRKGVCFIMALLMLVMIAVFALGVIQIEAITEYTTLFKNQDKTPMDEQVATIDPETDEEIPYEDQSTYVNILDPIYGFIKSVAGVEIGESPFYDEHIQKVEDGMIDPIAPLVLQWYPVAMLLFALLAVVSFIKAFFGMFGRRVYKRFGLSSIVMIIFGLAIMLGGYASNLAVEDTVNFADIIPFITQLFSAPVEGGDAMFTTVAGYASLALVGLPIITLLLSLGMRKKVPYSIFD